MRRLLLALATSGLILAGCGGSEGDQATDAQTPTLSESASPTPTDEPTTEPDPQDLWQQAVTGTLGADAAKIEAQLITNVEGFERIVAGTGYVEMDQGFGDITWNDDLGTTREVVSDSGHFLELDGFWLEVSGDSALPTTVAFDPLAGLADATNIVEVGSETVDGARVTRLDADLIQRDGIQVMGFSEEELTVFGNVEDASLIATIWVDSEGRIVRILREYTAASVDGDPISATNLYLITNVGQFQPIDVPETADALPAPV